MRIKIVFVGLFTSVAGFSYAAIDLLISGGSTMKYDSRLLILLLLSPMPLTLGWSQDVEDLEPIRCITLSRIDRTEVIDDQTIAFYLRNDDIYVNQLDRTCGNLDPGKPFSYRTSTSRICSSDSITVLENFGFGLTPGAVCGLGMFTPTDEDLLAMLKGEEEPAEVTVTPIEVDE